VIDTNVLVSTMLSKRGNEARVLELVRARLLRPVISMAVFAEYQSVLARAKFRIAPEDVDELLVPFRDYGMWVEPQMTLSVSPHEPDNRLLECAQAASASFLITGNLRHFPPTHGNTRIVNARTSLERYAATNP
jgi:putative PIN family toxin of toxin-antitoxin system